MGEELFQEIRTRFELVEGIENRNPNMG